jgi:C1A family cysteine protease
MKKLALLLFIVIGFIGCETSITQPPQSAFKISASVPVHQTGLISLHENIPGMKPAILSKAAAAALPASADLSNKFPPVMSQGSNLGSCTAFAFAYAYTYQIGLSLGWNVGTQDHQFSQSYLYNQRHYNNTCSGGGMYIASAIDILQYQGCTTLSDMPYNPACNGWSTQPTTLQRQHAASYIAAGGWQTMKYGAVNSIKAEIAAGRAVELAIEVASQFDYEFYFSHPNYIYNNISGRYTPAQYHTVCIVGYDDTKNAVKIINSWGTGWALSGYAWISYDLIQNEGWDAYAQTGNFVPPVAASDLNIAVYNNQHHVAYRDASGVLWDSYYDRGWFIQQINLGGLTAGPAAVGIPYIATSNLNQQHFVYRDGSGKIWDSWYDGSWHLQQINLGGKTTGPAATGDPVFSVYNNGQHNVYRDNSGKIWDSWYDGNWHLQQINLGGLTSGPAAAGDPFVSVSNLNQQHFEYRDGSGKIWDSWYDGSWHLQQINLGGKTTGPAATGDPVFSVYNNGQHNVYRDNSGKIWDSWYDGNWHLQQINLGGLTSGPAAAGDPFVSVSNLNQQHFEYRDGSGKIWDSWYDGSWHLQQINLGGNTTGPAAIGDPVFSVYKSGQHNVYRDASNILWDSWYDGSWHLQRII